MQVAALGEGGARPVGVVAFIGEKLVGEKLDATDRRQHATQYE
jgi:hypothetical protein